ncbi:DUF4179 domain-containing protein [Brevibacillus borstelensis]|uniref:DUF4179 domain-containing protein n=1 Tax=Brevibacillus borstelensis TaxID=45462 RepID=UPI0030C1E48A
MKCLTFEEMMEYLDGEITERERSQIEADLEAHLEDCARCMEKFRIYAEDVKAFDKLAEAPQLPDTFTVETMARIAAEKQEQAPAGWTDRFTNVFWRGTILKKITVVAAGVTLAISLSTFVSPTFASYVKSVFTSGEGTDNGLKRAAEQGLTSSAEAKATDQGITVAVKEVFADPMRIAAVFGFEKDGKAIKSSQMHHNVDLNGRYKFYVTDTAGNMVYDSGYRLGEHGLDTVLQISLQDMEKDMERKEISNNLVLHMEVSQIGDTKGKWNLSVPIDLQKLKEKVAVIPINSKYAATPPGMSIELKQAAKGVSATQLFYEVKLDDGLMKKYRDSMKYFEKLDEETGGWTDFEWYDISYRIVDRQGKVVAANKQGPEGGSQNVIESLYQGRDDPDKGVYTWIDAFDPTVVKNSLAVELTKVMWNELADFEFTFKPEDVAKKPQTKEYNGNTITIKSVSYNPVENVGSKRGFDRYKGVVMEVECVLAKDVVYLDTWTITDEEGKRFEPETHRKSDVVKNKDGNYSYHFWITAENWDKIPKTITLNAHRVVLQDTNVNWKVPIQLGE